jgi:hypothetical protein
MRRGWTYRFLMKKSREGEMGGGKVGGTPVGAKEVQE